MSRPSSPAAPHGATQGQWPHLGEPEAAPRRPVQPRWPQQPGLDASASAQSAVDPYAGSAAPAYGNAPMPHDPRHDPRYLPPAPPPSAMFGRPQAPARHPPPDADVAPQFAPYVPPQTGYPPAQQQNQHQQQAQQQAYADPYPPETYASHAPNAHGYQQGGHDAGYAQDPRAGYAPQGYEQWPPQQDPRGPDPRGPDPRGYDLASFGGPHGRQPAPPASRGDFGLRGQQAEPAEWQQHDQRYDDGSGFRDGGYAQPQHQYAGQMAGHEQDAAYEEPQEAEVEEGRGSRRGLMIVGALVGAIALGGGMAYAYKQFGGGKGGKSPPIIAAPKAPAKIKPVEAGGREFDHADKKLLERLDESRGTRSAQLAPPDRPVERDDSGALKVRTIPIGRDGNIGTPSPAAQSALSVPGLVLDGGAPPTRAAPPPPVEPRIDARPASTTQAPPSPQRSTAAGRPPPAPVAEAPPAPPATAPAARKPLVRDSAPAPRTAATETKVATAAPPAAAAPLAPAGKPSAVGAGGYVAVVSSQKSRMDALKAFADLQQKFGGVLQGKTPDVQEANLGDKGQWFRAVVGPPGSREAATGLCSQLKTAGYSGCWVAMY